MESSENKEILKLIALGEIVAKIFEMADRGKISPDKRKRFDSLVVSVTEEMKNRNARKAEKIVKSILTDILLYHETRADFLIKNQTRNLEPEQPPGYFAEFPGSET